MQFLNVGTIEGGRYLLCLGFFTLFSMDLSLIQALSKALIVYIIFMGSMCLRAWLQAYVGDRMGDPLPALEGRVTLNPFAHMDLWGSVVFPLIALLWPIFGGGIGLPLLAWSKPVKLALLNPKERVRTEVTVAAMGPLAHLVLCSAWATLGGLLCRSSPQWMELVLIGIDLNATLVLFNILPLPPLDGAILMRYILRWKDETYEALSRYSFFIFLILISFPFMRQILYVAIGMIAYPFRLLFSYCL